MGRVRGAGCEAGCRSAAAIVVKRGLATQRLITIYYRMQQTPHCPPDATADTPPKRVQKRSHRATRLQLPSMAQLDGRTNAARQFSQLAVDIENDLGGRDRLSEIEKALIQGFCGCSIALSALNVRLVRDGEQGVDLGLIALLSGAMCRLSSRLGTSRRPREVLPTVSQYLQAKEVEGVASKEATS
jgi:hypothetical protein